ncbi:MAG: hypothetical protein H8D96_12865 [Desulfobacterales bacterium]|uniref:Uncharacterized protein n=1 Tax=Candidatus Desulfatibia vada TaxID=2841696 RepID=A0A8J6P3F7_9BACT|nr:hypothetical protein [Candidatus Desulfatibia vada]MBL6970786.1 hypothetical protein [Desulfobacterales bacterium]
MMKDSLKSATAGSPAEQDHHVKDRPICITLTTPYLHKSRKLKRFLAFPDSIGGQGGNRGKQCGTFFESKSFQAIYDIVVLQYAFTGSVFNVQGYLSVGFTK